MFAWDELLVPALLGLAISALIGVGVALPVVLLGGRRAFPQAPQGCLTLATGVGLIAFLIAFLGVTRFLAMVPVVYVTGVGGMELSGVEDPEGIITREAWYRELMPPFDPDACYSGDRAACDFVDWLGIEESLGLSWKGYLAKLGIAGVAPAASTGVLYLASKRSRARSRLRPPDPDTTTRD
jgi:hypothetical protein